MKKRFLSQTHPELAKQFHTTKNHPHTSNNTTYGSKLNVYWVCPKNPNHIWQARVNNRSNGSKCPYCQGGRADTTNNITNDNSS